MRERKEGRQGWREGGWKDWKEDMKKKSGVRGAPDGGVTRAAEISFQNHMYF